MSPNPPIILDSRVEYSGRQWVVGAVGVIGGERYYWLIDEYKDVAMVPWFCVEAKS